MRNVAAYIGVHLEIIIWQTRELNEISLYPVKSVTISANHYELQEIIKSHYKKTII